MRVQLLTCPTNAAIAVTAAAVQDIAAVRDAMLDAAGNAWSGMREAAVDVMRCNITSA